MPKGPELVIARGELVINAARAGVRYRRRRAALADIDDRTLQTWMERGESDEPKDAPYREFLTKLRRAEADFVLEQLKNITDAGEKNWNASAWVLERYDPEHFGKKQADVQINVGKTYSFAEPEIPEPEIPEDAREPEGVEIRDTEPALDSTNGRAHDESSPEDSPC